MGGLPAFGSTSADGQASSGEESGGVWEEILALYEKAKEAGEQVPEDAAEWVSQDLQSIGDWEYKVVELGPKTAEGLEAKLTELGTDRWECFWVQTSGTKTRLLFKRPRKSWLQSIPLTDLIQWIP